MFENEGKPVRFASIDITVEQEVGDMYELVTSQSEIKTDSTYILVGRQYSYSTTGRALSVNETSETPSGNPTRTSTPVELLENGYRVKATGEVQLIKLEATGNSTRPYYLKMGSNYLRRRSGGLDGSGNNRGTNLYGVGSLSSYESDLANYFRTSITINGAATYYNALICFGHLSSETEAPSGGVKRTFAIRHRNSSGYFRDLDYSSNNSDAQYQRVYLYKPAKQYRVTTEVQPDASKGSISLRDGILVDNGVNWSQKMDTVQFLVTPADGYKIANLAIAYADDATTTIEPLTIAPSINGTLYTFVMPGNDVHIVATMEQVVYHNIYTEVKPDLRYGNIFLTEGYVVQNDQVKSYEGENVVFNVTANLKDIANESSGYYELSYVTVKDHVTDVETTIAADQLGNYNFTMPDNDVTITAYFYDDTKAPLWLLGDANGGKWTYVENNETKWHTYGPRFNYDEQTDEYYIDVYFKGTGNYGDNTGEAYGRFSVTWMIDLNDDWSKINGKDKRGVPGEQDFLVNETNTASTASPVYLWYGSQYENNAYKIPAGIYRIKIGTKASQNKGNLNENQLRVEKIPTTLAFNPVGGTAAQPVEVSKDTRVALEGDLYSKIMAINPDEPATNFMYKAVKTIGDNSTAEAENATGATTAITTLTEVNDGETVTELHGYNYLGWIVADNTAYYKVVETSLKWIEENGEPGKDYTVSNELVGVYRANNSLWCKDQLPYQSYAYMKPFTPDYMEEFATRQQPVGYDDDISVWDQSNWVELDFSSLSLAEGEDLATIINNLVGKKIAAGTVKGTYYNPNHKIVLTSAPTEGDALAYVPNTFCPANFMAENIDADGAKGSHDKFFFFLNPKVQEYAEVTMAVWVGGDDNVFVVPAKEGTRVNGNDFSGAFSVDWSLNNWDRLSLGYEADQSANLTAKNDNDGIQIYKFRAIIRVPETAGTVNAQRKVAGKDVTPDGTYKVFPLDLAVDSENIVTGVSRVDAGRAVQRVTYSDLAGRVSNRPFAGVNIVVTRYTDGTVHTSKAVF